MTPSRPASPLRRFQFGLVDLLVAAVACAFLCAIYAWGGDATDRVPELFLALAVGLFAAGWFRRSKLLIVTGLLMLLGMKLQLAAFSEQVQRQTDRTSWTLHQLGITVVDAATGRPIPGAAVSVVASNGPNTVTSRAQSDESGTATLYSKVPCYCASESNGPLLPSAGWFYLDGLHVEVNADGYAPAKIGLDEHYGQRRWDLFANGPLPPVTVKLRAK